MSNKKIVFIDENISTRELYSISEYITLTIEKGTLDQQIIHLINIIKNPVIFFTRNTKDFKGKLQSRHQIVSCPNNITRQEIEKYIPTAAKYMQTHTSTHKFTYLTLAKRTGSTKEYELRATGTGEKAWRL